MDGYRTGVLRTDEDGTGTDEALAGDGRSGPDERSARYEPVAPLPRPWERRAGFDRRPGEDRPEPSEADVPRWLPRRMGERVAIARHLAREGRQRTVGGARLVRDVADGVRDEAERVALDAQERARATSASVRDRRGVPTLLVGAAVVLAACTVLLVVTDPWEPSAGARGEVAWCFAVLAPFSRAESPFAWAMLAIPLMGAGGAVLVGLTAGASRRSAELLPVAGPVLPRLAIGAATLAVVLAGWGVLADARVIDRTPARPVALSDRTGAFRGVEVGDRLPAVRARLGTPTVVPAGAPAAGLPLDAPGDLALPDAELPEGETWRYDGLARVVSRSRVLAMVVTDDRAQTGAGAGIGDSMEIVRRAYGGLVCDGVRIGDAKNPAHPGCRSRLPGREGLRRVGIAFSGDPVQSVVLTRRATGALLEGGDPR